MLVWFQARAKSLNATAQFFMFFTMEQNEFWLPWTCICFPGLFADSGQMKPYKSVVSANQERFFKNVFYMHCVYQCLFSGKSCTYIYIAVYPFSIMRCSRVCSHCFLSVTKLFLTWGCVNIWSSRCEYVFLKGSGFEILNKTFNNKNAAWLICKESLIICFAENIHSKWLLSYFCNKYK